ncbi:MAG: NADH-quinone oxidoreductase subunit L, partial [Acidobacteria bacterium]|nr:NADH-quinone oxidoreductase subunit L [Acidobacteriota bacterium]
KKVLAYSTISQLGYMFLGLGVGSASAAIFHLVTHAFFKALLFLGAGAVIYACHHEHDIFRLGGLRRSLPTVTWTFVAGAAALAGFPLVTAGFYSKDLVLWRAFAGGHFLLWGAGLLGAFVTALYSFRLVFVVFWGETGTEAGARPGWRMTVPLTILAALSLVGGWLGLPAVLEPVLGAAEEMAEPHGTELLLQVLAGVVSLGGIALAWALYGRPGRHGDPVADALGPVGRWWRAGWGFDALYDRLFVRPYDAVARALEKDPVDRLPAAAAGLARGFHRALALTQNGRLRWYALSLAAGATFALYLVLTL